ncbi:MAG: isoprenylcysteine carboxylmethyltransferase family protein [Terriglobia bacterium]
MRGFFWIDVALFLGFGVFVCSQWQWNVRYLVGIGIAVVSFALWMVARVQLGKSLSVRAEARALVMTGLYSKLRHPIYLFSGLAYAGLFLAWGKLLLALAFFALTVPWQIARLRKEEAILEQAFGDEYRRYRASTWF